MNEGYYIYTHTSPSGKVYVGQTIDIKKRWGYNGEPYMSKKKDGTYVQASFARAINKYGWKNFKHSIILEGIPRSEADYAEKYLIRWYKIHGLSYNISDGGEGNCGTRKPLSEERKAKIKEFMKNHHPMRGRKHTPEAMAKIIYANRNREYTPEQKKKMQERGLILGQLPVSEERKRKYSEYRKNHPETWVGGWNKKEVHQYNLEGNYINSYSSVSEAAKAVGKKSCTDICRCIKGKVASAFGFIWKAKKEAFVDVSKYKVVKTIHGARLIDMSTEGRRKRRNGHGKLVNQYSLSGEYITTYNSITDAKEAIKCTGGGISKCCLHKPRYKSAGGFLWEYDTVDNRKDILRVAV